MHALDWKNCSILWADIIQQEMNAVKVVIEVLDDDESVQKECKLWGVMVCHVKMVDFVEKLG